MRVRWKLRTWDSVARICCIAGVPMGAGGGESGVVYKKRITRKMIAERLNGIV